MFQQDQSFLGKARRARRLHRSVSCDERAGKPIIAAVRGYCLAGGFGLALACDLLIAAEDAQFGTPEIKRGLFPMIIMATIARNVGRKKTLEMILTGERIDPGAEPPVYSGTNPRERGSGARFSGVRSVVDRGFQPLETSFCASS